MKRTIWLSLLTIGLLSAQNPMPNSVAVTDNALAIFSNPALLGYRSEMQSYWQLPYRDGRFSEEVGAYFMLGNLGLGGEWLAGDSGFYQRWQLALGLPLWRWIKVGGTVRWYGTVKDRAEYDLGFSARPAGWLSLGARISNISAGNDRPALAEFGVGVRPVGNRVTFAADLAFDPKDPTGEVRKKLYVDFEPLPGLSFFSNYMIDNQDFQIGIQVNALRSGIASVFRFGEEREEGALLIHTSAQRYRTFLHKAGKKVVKLELSGIIEEELPPLASSKLLSLKDILDCFRKIEKEDRVKAVVLEIGNLSAGFSKLHEIRNAILQLRASGKKVYCYSETYSNGGYFLASAADRVYLNPAGLLLLIGMRAQLLYFKDFFDKIGVEAEFEKVGAYKSAPEGYTQDSMSVANREQVNQLLDDFYSLWIEEIGASRATSAQNVAALVDGGPYHAKEALKTGMVDALLYSDQIKETLEKELGGKIALTSYKKEYGAEPFQTDWSYAKYPNARIALVYATGGITSGESRSGYSNKTMGAATIARALKQAREDPMVKAIVLRVDSPGGSSIASEIIWREVLLCTQGEHKKPVIVSMSGVAASGGYHIASAADQIFADPTTITGSIGVYSGKFNIEGLLDKLGIHSEIIKRGEHATLFSIYNPATEEERQRIRDVNDELYDRFTAEVAAGRGLSQEKVKAVGEGRVWSGSRAREIGLVDEIGGLYDAISAAKQAAGLDVSDEISLKILPAWWEDFIDLDFQEFMGRSRNWETLLPSEYQRAQFYFNTWLANNQEWAKEIMPFWLIFE